MAEIDTDAQSRSLVKNFTAALQRYDLNLYGFEHFEEAVSRDSAADSVLLAGVRAIEIQAADRTHMDFEHVLMQGDDALWDEHNVMLLVALFMYGRKAADGGAQIVINESRFGDHLEGLENVRIEPRVRVGDFLIDFVVTWEEHGPNPDHVDGDDSTPLGITVTKQAPVISRAIQGTRTYADLKAKAARARKPRICGHPVRNGGCRAGPLRHCEARH